MTVTIDRQIAALARAKDTRNERNRGEVARGKLDQIEATQEALDLDAALETMTWLQTNEIKIKAALAEAKHVTRHEGPK